MLTNCFETHVLRIFRMCRECQKPHLSFFLFLICGYHIEQQGAPRKLLKFSLSYKYLDATFYIHTFETTFSTFLLQTLFPMNFTVKYFDILLFHRNITIWHESKQRMCVIKRMTRNDCSLLPIFYNVLLRFQNLMFVDIQGYKVLIYY